MRNISKLRESVTRYVYKNLPRGIPSISKYIEAFIFSILSSTEVLKSLDSLDSIFGDDIREVVFSRSLDGLYLDFTLDVDDEGMLILCSDEPIPFFSLDSLSGVLSYTDTSPDLPSGVHLMLGYGGSLIFDSSITRYSKIVPSENFIIKDFCSFVGVSYRPEYKEFIIRSFVRKDLDFVSWLFKRVFGASVRRIILLRGSHYSRILYTTDEDEEAFTDSGFYVDMMSRSSTSLLVTFYSNSRDLINERFAIYRDLFMLVLPARFFVRFNFL